MPAGVQQQIETLAQSIPPPKEGEQFSVDNIPVDAVVDIARQFQPDADISADQVKQAMGMVKELMATQGDDASPDQLLAGMMKSMGGNFSK